MREKILQQVATYQDRLEDGLVLAAERFLNDKKVAAKPSNVLYDLEQSFKESLQLSRGGDWCYDRFTTGLMYGLYYQGRRINTSLTFAVDFVVEAIEQAHPIEVFDLGAGAGAVHVAMGLCVQAAHDLGYALPKIRLINVDISPFMLEYAHGYLIPALRKHFNAGFHQIQAEYEAVSWTNPHNIQLTNPYVVGSYVFDHSDNGQTVVETFNSIISRFDPECIVLLTSWNKRHLVDEFTARHVKGRVYNKQQISRNFLFKGPVMKLRTFRQRFADQHNINIGNHDYVTWDVRSFYGYTIKKRALKMSMATVSRQKPTLDLYRRPISIRRDVVLSKEQLKAAQPNDRPTIIMGSAGSGKSVVITERIKNLVLQHDYGADLRILLTSFNKELIRYLRNWMSDLLDAKRVTRSGKDHEHFHFDDSLVPNLTILNFDTLPTRIGKLDGQLKFDENGLADYVKQAITEIVAEQEIDEASDARYLDWQFVYAEYVRVIYGQLMLTREDYLACRRFGRDLNPSGRVRNYLFDIIRRFQELLLHGNKVLSPADTIHTRRQKFYRMLEEGSIPTYTHIMVDEFQDCTLADYKIFYNLLQDSNQLVLAGDYAQAVHLGPSVVAPRDDETDKYGKTVMRYWDRTGNVLAGSYRLPFRITECIRPLSQRISQTRSDVKVNILNPYKGAPPGARPILVYAKSEDKMATKLGWINHQFAVFDLTDTNDIAGHERRQIVILEKDRSLVKRINGKYPDLATTDTILRLKGMEKDCIVWSTRIGVDSPGDEDYYVYTILTRTRSILIIAVFDETPARYLEIVKLFDRERMIIWDRETEEHYRERVLGEVAVV